ncbi:MAG: TonB-dependent receptor domain-containing protein, partial [Planctomycetota bacterium]
IDLFFSQYQGNPDLEPETHYSAEVGGTCESDPCSVRWSVFYDIGFEAWDYVKDPAPSIVERPQNITEQMTYGLELEIEAKLSEDLSLVGSYTFVRPTYHEYDPDPTIEGNIIEDIPQHSGSIGLKWAFAEGFQLEARARSASSRFTDPGNNEDVIPNESIGKLDGFTVLDLGLGVALGTNVSVSVSVLNAFDTAYSVHGYLDQSGPIREPGRSVYAGMKARF